MTAMAVHQRVRHYLETKGGKYQDFYIINGVYYNLRHKAEASFHRRSKRYEFGIPKIHWDRYVQVAKDGNPVYSLIVEEKSNLVYMAKLTELAAVARVYSGDTVDTGGTVFLPRDNLTLQKSRLSSDG
jgi:hypothetical protein